MSNFVIRMLPGETVLELAERLKPIYGVDALPIAKQHVNAMRNDARWQTFKRAYNGDFISMAQKAFGR